MSESTETKTGTAAPERPRIRRDRDRELTAIKRDVARGFRLFCERRGLNPECESFNPRG